MAPVQAAQAVPGAGRPVLAARPAGGAGAVHRRRRVVARLTSGLARLIACLTLIVGRAWCGWLCPLGTLLDVIPPRRRPPPGGQALASRGVRSSTWLLAIVLDRALFGNLTLLIFDPMTLILSRTMTTGCCPACRLTW